MERTQAQIIYDKFYKVVQETFGDEYLLTDRKGTISDLSLTCKITLTPKAINGVSSSQVNWNKWCEIYELKPEHFGKSYVHGGITYTICGINQKARTDKKRIELSGNNGKKYTAPAEFIAKVVKI